MVVWLTELGWGLGAGDRILNNQLRQRGPETREGGGRGVFRQTEKYAGVMLDLLLMGRKKEKKKE